MFLVCFFFFNKTPISKNFGFTIDSKKPQHGFLTAGKIAYHICPDCPLFTYIFKKKNILLSVFGHQYWPNFKACGDNLGIISSKIDRFCLDNSIKDYVYFDYFLCCLWMVFRLFSLVFIETGFDSFQFFVIFYIRKVILKTCLQQKRTIERLFHTNEETVNT